MPSQNWHANNQQYIDPKCYKHAPTKNFNSYNILLALKKKNKVWVIINHTCLFSIKICVENNEAETKQTGFIGETWYGFRTGSNSGCNVGNIRKNIYEGT